MHPQLLILQRWMCEILMEVGSAETESTSNRYADTYLQLLTLLMNVQQIGITGD